MLKGSTADQFYSGQESEAARIRPEFHGKASILHPKHIYIKPVSATGFPSFLKSEDTLCGHRKNVLPGGDRVPSEVLTGLAQDRRLQEEQEWKELQKKVECPSCYLKGRLVMNSFLKNKEREALVKRCRRCQCQMSEVPVPDVGGALEFQCMLSSMGVLVQVGMKQSVGERAEDLLKAILCLQQRQAEDQQLFREQLLRQAAINGSLEAQIAAATAKSGTADPSSATKTAEQLLGRRRKLAYVPEAEVNPFPRRPQTLTSRMPQLYDLHGNKTYGVLAKKSNSSMKYESLVLGPALSYLHDVVTFGNDSLESVEDGGETLESLHQRCHEIVNAVQGVYSMLCNRWTMLELRAQLELDPSSSHRGGAEALRVKLQFVEDRVYQAADGMVADEVLQQWLNDFDKSRGKGMLNQLRSKLRTRRRVPPHAGDTEMTRTITTRSSTMTNTMTESLLEEKASMAGATSPRPMSDVLGTTPANATALSGRWLEQPHRSATGEAAEGSMVRSGRQLRGDAVDHGGLQTEVEVIEHLGLEVYLKHGQFRVMEQRVKIWRAAWSDLEWWSRLPAMSKWNGRKIWRSPTRAKVRRDSSMMAWGGVLNLKYAGRGFWSDEMRDWDITQLELEAVFKTVQAFLRELEGKTVVAPRLALLIEATASTPKVTVGIRLEAFWEDDDKFYPGMVKSFNEDDAAHMVYDDGDEETLNLSQEKFNILHSEGPASEHDVNLRWPVVVLCKDVHTVERADPKMLRHVRRGHPGDTCVEHVMDQGVPLGITERRLSMVHNTAGSTAYSNGVAPCIRMRTSMMHISWQKGAFGQSLRWFLKGAPENRAPLAYGNLAMGVDACCPLFPELEEALKPPDGVEWIEASHGELESRVHVLGALEML
ncbi:hypothetical protein CYMTET_12848 [Cymbomonas tetramitiformis]|uniref:Tudor domain-containing protein n=1 Tax=Cymbomonas tetramitiformis TaxID=36881 RepID=A0AAE0GJN4_9CHLO|nr:hypothetical protein CYMTET_12848 [Cymbomonas tetramitiformis]